MKKYLVVLLVAVFTFFVGLFDVSAMTEAELKTKVQNLPVSIPSEYMTAFNDYLDQYDVSAADCQYIADQIDLIANKAQNQGITTISQAETDLASDIKTAVANISSNTGVKATVLSNGKLSVNKYNSNEVYGVIGTHIATNTGSISILLIAGIISALGAIVLVYKTKKA